MTCSLISYFWVLPESPRWLMTKQKYGKAHKVFERIAKSNKKPTDCLKEIEALKFKDLENQEKSPDSEVELQKLNNEPSAEQEPKYVNEPKQGFLNERITFLQTIKILFTTKKIVIGSMVTFLNWLTNSLVYYGISYNTSDLSGDPYINFSLSAFVELLSVVMCQLTLERFGRKRPYCIAMLLAGVSLLMVGFVPAGKIKIFTLLYTQVCWIINVF